jgi:hypothetical protein
MESKPDNNPDEWAFIRHLARFHRRYALLGVEPDRRIQQFDQVILYVPPDDVTEPLFLSAIHAARTAQSTESWTA